MIAKIVSKLKSKLQQHSWLESAQSFLLPQICLLCQMPLHQSDYVCSGCYQELPWLNDSYCQICARPLPASQTAVCGKCLQKPPYFHKTVALWQYAPPLTKLIIQLKFQQKLLHANFLASCLIDKIHETYRAMPLPETLIPVPLHKYRLRERGFNQALEIAKIISKHYHIPIDLHSLTRIRHNPAQSSLPAAKRAANVRGVFALQRSLAVKHVAIIDDVMTTGSTVNAISRLLMQKTQIKQIDIWCCARSSH